MSLNHTISQDLGNALVAVYDQIYAGHNRNVHTHALALDATIQCSNRTVQTAAVQVEWAVPIFADMLANLLCTGSVWQVDITMLECTRPVSVTSNALDLYNFNVALIESRSVYRFY